MLPEVTALVSRHQRDHTRRHSEPAGESSPELPSPDRRPRRTDGVRKLFPQNGKPIDHLFGIDCAGNSAAGARIRARAGGSISRRNLASASVKRKGRFRLLRCRPMSSAASSFGR